MMKNEHGIHANRHRPYLTLLYRRYLNGRGNKEYRFREVNHGPN